MYDLLLDPTGYFLEALLGYLKSTAAGGAAGDSMGGMSGSGTLYQTLVDLGDRIRSNTGTFPWNPAALLRRLPRRESSPPL
jgi:hypothetical protein